ncbi:hypothetical protein ACFY1S_12605 [Micromonospora sp. NPDC000663]|uniref:hypothetical protein n=1 Tax=Micromonospora sp. NPDC000663 TaxID=3364218 RepID=UPI00369E8E07
MSRHAFAAYGLYVARRYRPDERLPLDDIGGTGHNLLALIHGLLNDLEKEPYRNDDAEEYYAVKSIDPAGRQIAFVADYGRFGLTGDIRHTRHHGTTHTYSRDESAVVSTRNMIVWAPQSTTAMFLTERYGNRGSGGFFLRQLELAFRENFNGQLLLHTESLIDFERWQEYRDNAKLTNIKVVRFGGTHDIGNGVDPDLIGKLVFEAKPRWGSEGFGSSMKSGLLEGTVSAQTIFGLGVHARDETRLTLDDGTQERTVIVGRENLPALIHPIEYDGDGRADDHIVYASMKEAAPTLAAGLGRELLGDWDTEEWPKAHLLAKMGAIRER